MAKRFRAEKNGRLIEEPREMVSFNDRLSATSAARECASFAIVDPRCALALSVRMVSGQPRPAVPLRHARDRR